MSFRSHDVRRTWVEVHRSAILRLPPSVQKAFAGGISVAAVVEYHRKWATWHREMMRINLHYKAKSPNPSEPSELDEDAWINERDADFHDALADAISLNVPLRDR